MINYLDDVPPAAPADPPRPMRVYFNAETGRIAGYDIGNEQPMAIAGCEHVEVETFQGAPHPLEHVVDPATRRLRAMTPAERRLAHQPTELEVRSARYHELKEFDFREGQDSWAAHRQALRDITKARDPLEMVRRWPLRPDGTDAIPHLRKRLPENN